MLINAITLVETWRLQLEWRAAEYNIRLILLWICADTGKLTYLSEYWKIIHILYPNLKIKNLIRI